LISARQFGKSLLVLAIFKKEQLIMRSLLILSLFVIYGVFAGGCRGKEKKNNNSDSQPPVRTMPSIDDPMLSDILVKQAKLEFSAMADTTGNGRSDLVHFTDLGVFVSLSNGDGFLKPKLWTRDFAWGDQDRFPRLLGDFNGDKKADIIGFGRGNVVVALSNGDSFGEMTVATSSFGYESADGSWSSQAVFPRMLGYVNDDRFIDIVACRSSGCYVALSNGTNFQMPSRDPWIADFSTERDGDTSSSGWTSFDFFPRFLGDVNGNGRSDIIGFGERGVWVSLAGNGQYESKGLDTPRDLFFGQDQNWLQQSKSPRLIGDIDGDGKVDVLGFDEEGEVYISYGKTGLSEHSLYNSLKLKDFIMDNQIAGKSLIEIPRFLADIDGDGKAELVFIIRPKDLSDPGIHIKKIN